ncbi:uncharacterized protein EI90DRAFT_3134674 [Cantharellus anzutake]|uniref:uncharacterized protein n=1 Tax=Cantharellus anzutake TaxID=1750568 RepID=UPI001906ECA3|nr:uncharacterized protein EI90DRAFT_3134674 [Cantharellus anzutake]KAF8316202.1 hypothetical protein EI90DRAFT_3134674 [Cantharellus anzutake]
MESAIISRLLAHTRAESFLGSVDTSSLTYRSGAASNGQSIRGSWVLQEKCNVLGEFAVFGVISTAELGPYGNQCSAPFNTWCEQGRSKLFADQIRALNRIKNASGLGVHCEEDVIEIRDNEFGWAYLDEQNSPYIRILHPMFLENCTSVLKEGKKVNVSLAFKSDVNAAASTSNEATHSVFSEPQWDPEGHFRHALPAPSVQRDFRFHIDLHAFDDEGADVPCDGLEMIFKDGMAVIGTVSLHFTRARNTTRGEIRSFQLHWTGIQIVGQTKMLQDEATVAASSSKKRVAEEMLPGPPKRGPFFTRGVDDKKPEKENLVLECNTDGLSLLPPVESPVMTKNLEKGKGRERNNGSSIECGTQNEFGGKGISSLHIVKKPLGIEDEMMDSFTTASVTKNDVEDWGDV